MSESNSLPAPQPSTALLVEVIVPGFIRVNIPKSDAEKLYESLGVTLGHRPASNPAPQQSLDLNVMRLDKGLAGVLSAGRSALNVRLTQIRRDIGDYMVANATPDSEERLRKLREEEAICSELMLAMTTKLQALRAKQPAQP